MPTWMHPSQATQPMKSCSVMIPGFRLANSSRGEDYTHSILFQGLQYSRNGLCVSRDRLSTAYTHILTNPIDRFDGEFTHERLLENVQ